MSSLTAVAKERSSGAGRLCWEGLALERHLHRSPPPWANSIRNVFKKMLILLYKENIKKLYHYWNTFVPSSFSGASTMGGSTGGIKK